MNKNTMKAQDAISGSMAECFITIDKNRYHFMQLINFEANFNVNIAEIPILGRLAKGHKPGLGNGEWSGTAHYNQSVIRELLLKYKNTGVATYFDIQVVNEDPTSSVGRQTVILKECLTEGGILSKFDIDADYLDEDISGTFDDFELPEKFSLLAGMR